MAYILSDNQIFSNVIQYQSDFNTYMEYILYSVVYAQRVKFNNSQQQTHGIVYCIFSKVII